MTIDHRFVAAMVEELPAMADGPLAEEGRRRAQRLLHGLKALLDVHFNKENEVYVPLLDRLTPSERAALHDRLAGGGEGQPHHHKA
jgi:Hemerythrin HHE cation binding domain